MWASGAPWIWPGPPGGERFTSRPASLKYGWNAHNYLGLADAWELRGDESDEQLVNYFEAPSPVRDDAQARALWLEFVRVNRGSPNPDCAKPTITALSGSMVTATGPPPLTYEWFAGESGVTTTPVAEGASLSAPPGRYWVRVTNRCGAALSATATISASSPRRRAVKR